MLQVNLCSDKNVEAITLNTCVKQLISSLSRIDRKICGEKMGFTGTEEYSGDVSGRKGMKGGIDLHVI